ncbi:MAG: hypothetical protein JWN31_2161 [Frankiales bacterium]|nr:hypothetical protein [Frankiales bacterium]
MTRRVAALVVVALLLVLGSATASYAYFRTNGSGTGTVATAGSASPVTVTTNATVTRLLQPGGTADLIITVTNPNAFAVSITSVTSGGAVTAASGIGSCTTTGVTAAVPAADLPLPVPAHTTAGRFVLANAVTMSTASESGCQGATFTVPLTITAHQ